MNKVKSLSQQNLSLLLAIYIGIFLNLSVFYRRFDSLAHGIQGIKLISAVTEVIAIVLFTFFIMRLVSLGGRLFYRIVASLLVLISVAASYYMTFFNVVIGYGIVVSVMTTDIDLSKEVVGLHFVLWMVALSALPLLLIWKNSLRFTLIEQLKTPGHRIKPLLVLLAVVALVWLPLRMLDDEQSVQEKLANVDLPSYGGVVAHSYLPSNWLSALGLFAYTRYDESQDQSTLFDPGKHFTYVRRRTSTIPTWCSSSARPRAGITWACWATSAILRRACRKRRIWWRSAASLATPPPSCRCAACSCAKAVPRTTRSAR